MTTNTELVADFLKCSAEEDQKLARSLEKLGAGPRQSLGEVLSRFDRKRQGALDENERVLARRVLTLIHRPSGKILKMLCEVLDFLDVNENKILEAGELALAVDILEAFCKAGSINSTLSTKEMEVLLVVLKQLDLSKKGVLDQNARRTLRDSLWDPDAFLAEQAEKNPDLKKLLG